MRSGLTFGGRVVAAALILATGILHFKLYFDAYRDVDKVGPLFIAIFVGSIVVAALLLLWRHWLALVIGLGFVDAILIGFGVSRTSRGVFDFSETGFKPSPEAVLSLTFEI